MATVKELEDAILALDKAGDYEGVRVLGEELSRLKQSPQKTISFDEAFQRPESMLPEPLETAASFVGQSLLKGGSKLARGVVSAPFDIASYFTEDPEVARKRAARGEAVRQAIPEFTGGMAGTDLAGTIAQYAVPATVGYKGARAAASLLGAGGRLLYPAGILGAAAGDVIATVPEEAESIGSLVGAGPTQITPEDTAFERRVKTGAETLALGPIVDLALALPRTAKRLTGGAEKEVAEHFQKYTQDVPAAVSSIEKGLEITPPAGYAPTAAELTEDTGLAAIQKNVSKTPSLVERKEANLKALSGEARSFAEGIEDPYLFKSTVDDFVESATSASREVSDIANLWQGCFLGGSCGLNLSLKAVGYFRLSLKITSYIFYFIIKFWETLKHWLVFIVKCSCSFSINATLFDKNRLCQLAYHKFTHSTLSKLWVISICDDARKLLSALCRAKQK